MDLTDQLDAGRTRSQERVDLSSISFDVVECIAGNPLARAGGFKHVFLHEPGISCGTRSQERVDLSSDPPLISWDILNPLARAGGFKPRC